MPRVLESLVQLLQDEDSVLESLSLVDSKLKNDTCLLINALGSNQSLVNIDVTGNNLIEIGLVYRIFRIFAV